MTTVSSGQTFVVSSGVIDNGAIVLKGGTLVVSSGGRANFADDSGTIKVFAGGTISGVTVASGGYAIISSIYTPIDPGEIDILGGTASNVTLNTSSIFSMTAGSVNNLTFNGYTNSAVMSGGTITNLNLISGSLTEAGGSISGVTITSGSLTLTGGVARNISANGGNIAISGPGSAYNLTLTNSAFAFAQTSDAVISGVTLGPNSILGTLAPIAGGIVLSGISAGLLPVGSDILSGATLSGFSNGNFVYEIGLNYVSGASALDVQNGNVLRLTEGNSSAFLRFGAATNLSGQILKLIPIGQFNATILSSFATSSSITSSALAPVASSLAYLDVFSGGSATLATVSSAGVMFVEDGGYETATTISKGGTLINTGTGANEVVQSGGSLIVLSGSVVSTKVNSGGNFLVASDGSAFNPIVSGGGTLNVYAGGVVSSSIVSGDTGSTYTCV